MLRRIDLFSVKCILSLFLIILVNVNSQSCSTTHIRREIREYMDDQGQLNSEGQKFVGGVKCLMSLKGENGSVYDDFTATHLENSRAAHNAAAFFPWHRLFLVAFENAIRECVGDNTITIPYWDIASTDAQNLENSIVWSEFGRDGGVSNCVEDGEFKYSVLSQPRWKCIQRQFSVTALPSFEVVSFIQSNRDYATFRDLLESQYHANVHIWLGGDMAQLYSPNDPLFYLHHSYIDFIWHRWQEMSPESFFDYSGPTGFGGDATTADLLDMHLIAKYAASAPVSNMFNITDWCYSYAPSVVPVDTFGSGLATRSYHGSPYNKKTPDSTDRSDYFNIRKYDPLPEEYITRMNYDLDKVRMYESVIFNFIDYVNSQDGFISPSAIGITKYKTATNEQYQQLQTIESSLVDSARQELESLLF